MLLSARGKHAVPHSNMLLCDGRGDADISGCRIPIIERVELPESWIPADSRVEIDAKITAGKHFYPFIPLSFHVSVPAHWLVGWVPRHLAAGEIAIVVWL